MTPGFHIDPVKLELAGTRKYVSKTGYSDDIYYLYFDSDR
jgi:hypothetical protein